MKTQSWEEAERLLAEQKERPSLTSHVTKTIAEAVRLFQNDAASRNLKPETLAQHRRILTQLVNFGTEKGKNYLQQLTFEDVLMFRQSWPDQALSAYKKLGRLKGFFKFCVRASWIKQSPAEGVRPPKLTDVPTLPFTQPEMASILKAIDGHHPLHKDRLRAFTLTLRYTGLRIRDAVQLTEQKVQPGRVFLRQQKTGESVYIPIPEFVEKAIRNAPGRTSQTYFFWSGTGKPRSCVGNWQRAFESVFKSAGIENGHPHRFRDTFAVELLLAGVPMEDVSILLGHSSIRTTEKSYSPWVKARQKRLEEHVMAAWGASG